MGASLSAPLNLAILQKSPSIRTPAPAPGSLHFARDADLGGGALLRALLGVRGNGGGARSTGRPEGDPRRTRRDPPGAGRGRRDPRFLQRLPPSGPRAAAARRVRAGAVDPVSLPWLDLRSTLPEAFVLKIWPGFVLRLRVVPGAACELCTVDLRNARGRRSSLGVDRRPRIHRPPYEPSAQCRRDTEYEIAANWKLVCDNSTIATSPQTTPTCAG